MTETGKTILETRRFGESRRNAVRIAFWNTHKNEKINDILVDVIKENRIDIIVLAEYVDDKKAFLRNLSQKEIFMEQYRTFGCERVVMFGSVRGVEPDSQNKYYSIQVIHKKYILCGLHFPSQIYNGHQLRRNIVIRDLLWDITELERELHLENTILLGDFNENPYESGCLEADKLHAISSSNEAQRGSRKIMGQEFKLFYNPMWNLFGDFKSPPGTYYYNGSTPDNPFWNIYDQVLIRPVIRQSFREEGLEILTGTGKVSFTDENGHPRKEISDHLPIVFEIEER